jgi:hypothetical protein
LKAKPFNQEVHDACDPVAREAVINFMASKWNRTAYPHPDKYKVDLIVENEFMVPVCYAEIEMRDWESCPFPTVHVPSRKKKLVDNDLPTLYFVVSKGLKKALWCEGESIVESPLREVPNKAVKAGEYFYDVPINKFKEVLL